MILVAEVVFKSILEDWDIDTIRIFKSSALALPDANIQFESK